ncbi:MAG: hypothetical protein NVS9B10_07070 [Nevskia sp.]
MSTQAKADSRGSHLHGAAVEPLLRRSRLSCGPLVGGVQSKQRNRLGDIPVKVQ